MSSDPTHSVHAPAPADNGRQGNAAEAGPTLQHFFDHEVMPRLRAEDVFTHPAHEFQRDGDKWRGGCPWHDSESGTAFYIDSKTLRWRCPACDTGGGALQYLHKLQRGVNAPSPRGRDFVDLVKAACEKAGLPFPERNLSHEERERFRLVESRRAILTVVIALCQDRLWSAAGEPARTYLAGRGLDEAAARELGLGLYPPCGEIRHKLAARGFDPRDIEASAVVFERMEGHAVFPWLDDRGAPLTLYGKWPEKMPPEGKPKTMALPNPKGSGERTKHSPLYLDRATGAGHKQLVLVEGVTDAALAQVKGDTRVVACVAAELSGGQVKALKRHGVESIVICLDPDAGGAGGVRSCIRSLHAEGIRAYVAPTLPDGVDPDDFILGHGIDGWRRHVAQAVHAYRHVAEALLAAREERLPGDDGWDDALVSDAVTYAAKLPAGRDDEVFRHLLPPVASATGADCAALMDRIRSERARLTGCHTNGTGAPGAGEKQPEKHPSGFRFEVLDSPTFAVTDYRPEWLVKNLFVRHQAGIIGGPRKALKTSIEIDLALSLGTATPFLGTFEVPHRRRTVLLSGESGEWTLQETARRVCAARNVELRSADVLWGFRLPQLSSPADMDALRKGLEANKVEVCIIDPLYLCATDRRQDIQASSLYDMGPLLLAVTRACLDVDCTTVLVHHARKNLSDPLQPLELEDLAFAGIQEFARQWFLISRRLPYEPGSGVHHLWGSAGGSVGHGGCWAIDIEEGTLREDFTGRKWDVSVTLAREARQAQAELGDRRKQERETREDKADDAKILNALDRLSKPEPAPKRKRRKKGSPPETPALPAVSCTQVVLHAKLSHARGMRSIHRLLEEGIIEKEEVAIKTGTNHKASRTVMGIRRRACGSETGADSTVPTVPTERTFAGQCDSTD